VLAGIAALKAPRRATGEVVEREKNYFAAHVQRMNYLRIARRGWPIGSGPVESACRQKQSRFKRPRQFWTSEGLRHLGTLTEARHNHEWEELWTHNYTRRHKEIRMSGNGAQPSERFIGLFPIGELLFNCLDYAFQSGEVTIVQAKSAGQFPDALDRIQIRAVGRQVTQH
jgi:hypothetical protein